jgi:hypothetical protein
MPKSFERDCQKLIEFTRLIGLRTEWPVETISLSDHATRRVVELMPSNLGPAPAKDAAAASAALQGIPDRRRYCTEAVQRLPQIL